MYKTLKYYKLGAILLALFLALPIFGIFAELFYILFQNFNTSNLAEFSSIKENLSHFFNYLFLKFIKDTFIISVGVLCLSLILGVSSAYLIANYDFYFCKILEKLLILPLAIPAYILAFVYMGIMDFQGFFHENFGFRIDFFNHYGVIFVLGISLYPYIYLFAKTAFKSEAKEAYEVAKIMKYSEFRIFTRVALLSARPAIFSGALLVLMETLSDYGASAYLGVDTFSAGIFKLWYDLNDSYSSSVLSSILMLFVFLDKIFHISLLGNSLIVLVFAYIIRFLASAIYSLEGGYNKIHLNIDEASLNLRASYFILFFKIHTPLMKHFLFLAFIIVFIDTIKELPLSRILAPFGFETLSVKAFWFASDERIYDAALPSLFIVFLSLIVVIWMDKITRKDDVRN